MKTKHFIQGALLIMLGAGMTHYIISNPNGLRAQKKLSQTLALEHNKVDSLKQNIAALEQEINSWQENTIHRERIARQDLHMSYTDEIVYFIK